MRGLQNALWVSRGELGEQGTYQDLSTRADGTFHLLLVQQSLYKPFSALYKRALGALSLLYRRTILLSRGELEEQGTYQDLSTREGGAFRLLMHQQAGTVDQAIVLEVLHNLRLLAPFQSG